MKIYDYIITCAIIAAGTILYLSVKSEIGLLLLCVWLGITAAFLVVMIIIRHKKKKQQEIGKEIRRALVDLKK